MAPVLPFLHIYIVLHKERGGRISMFDILKAKKPIALETQESFKEKPGLEPPVYRKPSEPEYTERDFIVALQQIYSEIINLKQDVMDMRNTMSDMKQVNLIIQAQEERKK
jgi:hypothetical protein